jgi:Fe-S-cluster containining protein
MCTECGSCCGALLPVSRKELDRIVEYVERNGVKPYVDRGPWVQVEFDLTCPFLDRGKRRNKCRIYEVRPFICRVFNCHIEMNPLEAIKVRNHYADGDVDVVNMRELFGEG